MNLKDSVYVLLTIVTQVIAIIFITLIILALIRYTPLSSYSEVVSAVSQIGLALAIICFAGILIHRKTPMSFGKQIIGSAVILIVSIIINSTFSLGFGALYLIPLFIGGIIWLIVSIVGYFVTRTKNEK